MRATIAILAIVLLTGLAACSDPVAPNRGGPGPRVAPASVQVTQDDGIDPLFADYRYNPEGKPDPFRSFIRVSLDSDSVTSPLERFDLSQLRVTGILWGREEPRALIRDPAGKAYVVAVGTSIGKNKGRVVRIEDNRVMVKETYVDFRDRATTKEIEMNLYQAQGG